MGLAASQARFLGLTARKSDLEYQGQQINQARSELANQTDALFNYLIQTQVPNADKYPVLADGSNDTNKNGLSDEYEAQLVTYSQNYQNVSTQVEKLHLQDRGLETRLRAVDSHHNEVQTEIDAVKKVIEKNIEGTFKTFA